MNYRNIIGMAFIMLSLVSGCTKTEESEWISLFNGEDLSGWHVACIPEDRDKEYWKVIDGMIVCDSVGDRDHDYVWLVSDNEYADFELNLKFQAYKDSTGNSGVQIRSRYDDSPGTMRGGWLDGPQVDIHPPAPWRTGKIYDETRGEQRWIFPSLPDWKIDPSFAPDELSFVYADEWNGWNEMRILCQGTSIKVWLNGIAMTDYDGSGILDNEDHKKRNVGMAGHLALQLHMKDSLKIAYKDIRIKEL